MSDIPPSGFFFLAVTESKRVAEREMLCEFPGVLDERRRAFLERTFFLVLQKDRGQAFRNVIRAFTDANWKESVQDLYGWSDESYREHLICTTSTSHGRTSIILTRKTQGKSEQILCRATGSAAAALEYIQAVLHCFPHRTQGEDEFNATFSNKPL